MSVVPTSDPSAGVEDFVRAELASSGFEFSSSGDLLGLSGMACPYEHTSEMYLTVSWEQLDDEGILYWVECGCGAPPDSWERWWPSVDDLIAKALEFRRVLYGVAVKSLGASDGRED